MKVRKELSLHFASVLTGSTEVKNGFGLHKKDVDSEHLQKALRVSNFKICYRGL